MSFGNNLKKIRQEKNMTQEELAKRINTSRSNIANYENDKNMPSIDILNKLSEILNCTTDYLLGKSNIRSTNELDLEKELLNIGLNKKDYTPPTKEQQEKIEEFARFVLKDNLKK